MTSAFDLFTQGFLPSFHQSGQNYLADKRHESGLAFDQQQADRNYGMQQAVFQRDQAAAEAEAQREADRFEALQLAAANLPPELQQAVMANPDLLGTIVEQQITPEKPVSLAPGGRLINPETGEVMASSPFKPDAPVETYRQVSGADLGLTGAEAAKLFNVSNKSNQVAGIGGGGVTVNTGEKVAQVREGERAKAGVKRQTELAERRKASEEALYYIDQAASSVGKAPSGAGADIRTSVSRVADIIPGGRTGLDALEYITGADVSVDVESAERMQEASKRNAMASLKATFGGSQITDSERKALESVQISTNDTQVTQVRKAKAQREMMKHGIKLIDAEDRLLSAGMSPADAQREARAEVGAMPGMKDEDKKSAQELTSPGGVKYKVRTSL